MTSSNTCHNGTTLLARNAYHIRFGKYLGGPEVACCTFDNSTVVYVGLSAFNMESNILRC